MTVLSLWWDSLCDLCNIVLYANSSEIDWNRAKCYPYPHSSELFHECFLSRNSKLMENGPYFKLHCRVSYHYRILHSCYAMCKILSLQHKNLHENIIKFPLNLNYDGTICSWNAPLGKHAITRVPVEKLGRIWMNNSHESTKDRCNRNEIEYNCIHILWDIMHDVVVLWLVSKSYFGTILTHYRHIS